MAAKQSVPLVRHDEADGFDNFVTNILPWLLLLVALLCGFITGGFATRNMRVDRCLAATNLQALDQSAIVGNRLIVRTR